MSFEFDSSDCNYVGSTTGTSLSNEGIHLIKTDLFVNRRHVKTDFVFNILGFIYNAKDTILSSNLLMKVKYLTYIPI